MATIAAPRTRTTQQSLRAAAEFTTALGNACSRAEVVEAVLQGLVDLGLSALIGGLEDDQLRVLACALPPGRTAAAEAALDSRLPLLGVGVVQAALQAGGPVMRTAAERRRLASLFPVGSHSQLAALGLDRGAVAAVPLEAVTGAQMVLMAWGPAWRPRMLPLLRVAAAHQAYAWKLDRGPALARSREPGRGVLLSQRIRQQPDLARLEPAVRPVVRLIDRAVIAYEGLCGFAPTRRFHSPAELVAAVEPAVRARLEAECCARVLPLLRLVGPGALFVRLSVDTLQGDGGRAIARLRAAAAPSVDPAQLVVELDAAVAAAAPRRAARLARSLRAAGLRIAVTELGRGPVQLEILAELGPDYLIADRGRIAGIDRSAAQRAILLSLLALSAYTNGRLVARGIETDAELAALMSLGVQFGEIGRASCRERVLFRV